MQLNPTKTIQASTIETNRPLLICLLGHFDLLTNGQPLPLRGSKAKTLLATLALRPDYCASRDALLHALWPQSDDALAGQSLNSLVYSLHKRLGQPLAGATPVLYLADHYRLNVEAGVSVDVALFDALITAGEQQARMGDADAAAGCFSQAVNLYRGDLSIPADVQGIVESERLRALYLTLLARLADYYYAARDDPACLAQALRLLSHDPCREDAHRLVMRCYVRRGERAQALRQYRLCEEILRAEFNAAPEPATQSLFNQIRLDPGSI